MPPKRYFDDLKEDSNTRPGHLSKKLREAMGMSETEVPMWIYRMRIMGYPPGWSAQATIPDEEKSLRIFDTNDQEIHPEVSESKTDSLLPKPPSLGDKAYDPSKFHAYPGFNCPLPDGVLDEWELFPSPPMLIGQQLAVATQSMSVPEPKNIHINVAKRLHKNNADSSPDEDENDESGGDTIDEEGDRDSVEIVDEGCEGNDLEEGEEPDEDVELVTPPVVKKKRKVTAVSQKVEKKETTDRIDDTNEMSSTESENIETDQISAVTENLFSVDTHPDQIVTETDNAADEDTANSSMTSTTDTNGGTPSSEVKLRLITAGSPLPASHLAARKPDLAKWSEGMDELIYFSNLPNYTGTFKKMKDVIGSIRKKLSK